MSQQSIFVSTVALSLRGKEWILNVRVNLNITDDLCLLKVNNGLNGSLPTELGLITTVGLINVGM